jgi:uncharacterized membrane protein
MHLEYLDIFGDKNATFWPEYWRMFNRIILGQFLEWIIIALIGGAIIGALSLWFIHRMPKDFTKEYESGDKRSHTHLVIF